MKIMEFSPALILIPMSWQEWIQAVNWINYGYGILPEGYDCQDYAHITHELQH